MATIEFLPTHLAPPLDELLAAKELAYDKMNFDFRNLKIEAESKEYGACTFELNGMKVIHRVSKITLTKTGQFVAIWKRNKKGMTEPYDYSDDFDLLIITGRKDDHFGQFVFPKAILVQQKIITANNIEGKRGIRVYSPWDNVESKQAEKTQKWQTEFFLTIKPQNQLKYQNEQVTDFMTAKNFRHLPHKT